MGRTDFFRLNGLLYMWQAVPQSYLCCLSLQPQRLAWNAFCFCIVVCKCVVLLKLISWPFYSINNVDAHYHRSGTLEMSFTILLTSLRIIAPWTYNMLVTSFSSTKIVSFLLKKADFSSQLPNENRYYLHRKMLFKELCSRRFPTTHGPWVVIAAYTKVRFDDRQCM